MSQNTDQETSNARLTYHQTCSLQHRHVKKLRNSFEKRERWDGVEIKR